MLRFLLPFFALGLACGGLSKPPTPAASDPEPAPAPEPVAAPASAPEPAVEPDLPAAAPPPLDRRPPWHVNGLCAVPQPADADELILDADDPAVLEDGLILCRVRMSDTPPRGRRWDVFKNPPDPSVRLDIDGTAHGPACADDTMAAVLTWPGADLGSNSKLKLTAIDVDIRNHDPAGTDIVIFEGAYPMELNGSHFSAKCRAMSAEVVTVRMSGRVDAARRSAKSMRGQMAPDPERPDCNFPGEAEQVLRQRITDVAALVGWEDDRLGGLLGIYESLHETWGQMAGDEIRRVRAGLPASAEIRSGVTATVSKHDCGGRCQLFVTMQNTGESEVNLGDELLSGTFNGVLPSGRDRSMAISSPHISEDSPIVLGPGDEVTVVLGEQTFLGGESIAGFGPDETSLLRVVVGGRSTLLPIPE